MVIVYCDFIAGCIGGMIEIIVTIGILNSKIVK